MNQEVCALVVTFNRRVLLRECLDALLHQSMRLDRIFVVDNASTDGTDELFTGEYAGNRQIEYIRLEQNGGGAGGFRRGLQHAHQSGFQWIWLMDDDTIPTAGALEALLAAYDRFPDESKPCVLSSKVLWTDGSLHSMNVPTIKRSQMDPERMFLAAENGTISVRWASFVSLLVHRRVVDEFGLPYGDYFIWNDDTEYTARVLRQGFGVVVPQSTVTHKTGQKHSPMDAAPARSYYQARNVLWMILRSAAWEADEKVKIGMIHIRWIVAYLRRNRFSAAAIQAISRGVRDGLFTKPAN
jgi:GT2 family glycosyltransferase